MRGVDQHLQGPAGTGGPGTPAASALARPSTVIRRSRCAAASHTAAARAALLAKWKCSAPLLTPARALIVDRDTTSKPSLQKSSAADSINALRVRTARSCWAIRALRCCEGRAGEAPSR